MDFFIVLIIGGVAYFIFSIIRERFNQEKYPVEKNPTDLYAIAEQLKNESGEAAHPRDLLHLPAFKQGIDHFNSLNYSTQELLSYYTGENSYVAWMALAALARRKNGDEILTPILSSINISNYWTRYFAFRVLAERIAEPVVGALLAHIGNIEDEWWVDSEMIAILKEFITDRQEEGETPTFGASLNNFTAAKVNNLEKLLDKLGGKKLCPGLMAELQQWRLTHVNIDFLKTFGRIWDGNETSEKNRIISHDYLQAHVDALEAALMKQPPRSGILVGESGVGKTATLRVLAERMRLHGWLIFEAGGVDLLSGRVYIGQLEERLLQLVRNISGDRKVLWIVPDIHELAWAGRNRYSPTGVLDYILPYVENGEITIIGETRPLSFEQLLLMKPRLTSIIETYRINPLSNQEATGVAREWLVNFKLPDGAPCISEQTLSEAVQLTTQYLGDRALPGNLLQLLKLTHRRSLSQETKSNEPISRDELLLTLTQLTGLPANILDDRQGLDLQALREFFQERVLGQKEAIDCLVERVAMIKAGLTDPTRPQGVFLFVGPTGTGKTEIVKALTEFLFGSPQRMIRLDMSEFQTPESLSRLLGSQQETTEKTALVNLIRNQPFSVLLLDEFEKAHQNIWDLFLQVFDDGRLTDTRGNTADFRHSIIILTSNLGANIPLGTSIGFSDGRAGFTAGSVERAVSKVFRKEFINRLDRVVVFKPLGTSEMKQILQKELNQVLTRRGLRTRSWAVEWDDSAIDFLLKKGFTYDLGARPLKRAIERYLLSPLAITIVNHQFPEGDQFLFVRSEGQQIKVEFIDPDAPEEMLETDVEPEENATMPSEQDFRVEKLILDTHGTAGEVEFLQGQYKRLKSQVESDEWQNQKQSALVQTANSDFWNSPQRFAILGLAEYMDRIETGLSTAASLLNRIVGSNRGDRTRYSKNILQRLAQQIYLIDAACAGLEQGRPRDAFLLINASKESGKKIVQTNQFAKQLGVMYRQWAEIRKMHLIVLEETGGAKKQPYRLLLSVSGFAAFTILEAEAGLHVLEIPGNGRGFVRCKVRVQIAPQPEEPFGPDSAAHRADALRIFSEMKDQKLAIVRRYREAPSPLVRDSVRLWRTGNLDRVLSGNFDVIC